MLKFDTNLEVGDVSSKWSIIIYNYIPLKFQTQVMLLSALMILMFLEEFSVNLSLPSPHSHTLTALPALICLPALLVHTCHCVPVSLFVPPLHFSPSNVSLKVCGVQTAAGVLGYAKILELL